MRRAALAFLAVLWIGCAADRTVDYAWDVSVTPIAAHEYEFRGTLKRTASQYSRFLWGTHQGGRMEVLTLPTLKVSPDRPAEVELGPPGEEPSVKATVTVEETGERVVVLYSAVIRDGATHHALQGRTEIIR